VVGGGGDQAAQAVGCGIISEGLVSATLGTSGVVFAPSDTYRMEPEGRLHAFCHAVPGKWHLMGVMLSAAGSFRWYRDTLAEAEVMRAKQENRDPYDLLTEAAATVQPGCEGLLFLPYLTGERAPLWNPRLRGAFIGLSLSHGRKEMARAVVESIAYGLRLAADRIREGGFAIDVARCSGGAARDDALCAIKSDVLGVPVEVPQSPECEAMGDACACAVALGDYGGLAEASAAMVRVESRFEPDERTRSLYDGRYAAWKDALDAAVRLSEPRDGPAPLM